MDYYYNQLNEAEKKVYTDCLKTLRRMEKRTEIGYRMSPESIENVIRALQYDHTGLFYVDYSRVYYTAQLLKTVFTFHLTEDDETVKQQRLWLRRKLKELDAERNQNPEITDQRTLLRWIQHKLVRNVKYHHEALAEPEKYPRAYSILGALQDHRAVCQGIAYAFKVLCDYFEIPCFVALGNATLENIGENTAHAWNIVCLNGKYTHIDVTWDIGVAELSSFYRYDYFCIPDSWIRQDHEFSGYPPCTDESLNYFMAKERMFEDYSSLKNYLKNELKNHKGYLYFKMAVQDSPENITKKTDQLVYEAVGRYVSGRNLVQRISGGIQLCFFYRITHA